MLVWQHILTFLSHSYDHIGQTHAPLHSHPGHLQANNQIMLNSCVDMSIIVCEYLECNKWSRGWGWFLNSNTLAFTKLEMSIKKLMSKFKWINPNHTNSGRIECLLSKFKRINRKHIWLTNKLSNVFSICSSTNRKETKM